MFSTSRPPTETSESPSSTLAPLAHTAPPLTTCTTLYGFEVSITPIPPIFIPPPSSGGLLDLGPITSCCPACVGCEGDAHSLPSSPAPSGEGDAIWGTARPTPIPCSSIPRREGCDDDKISCGGDAADFSESSGRDAALDEDGGLGPPQGASSETVLLEKEGYGGGLLEKEGGRGGVPNSRLSMSSLCLCRVWYSGLRA